MCGRYSLTTDPEQLAERFGVQQRLESFEPNHNVRPTQEAPVVIERDGERQLVLMRWGLIPSWAEDMSIGARMINARAETVAEKSSFKNSLRKYRCLVPADGFYEWQTTGKKKQPFVFQVDGGDIFALAGLYSNWKRPDGQWLQSYTIITTEPNELVAPVHNRMPVGLPRDAEALWLDPTLDDPHALQAFLRSFDADRMRMQPVVGAL